MSAALGAAASAPFGDGIPFADPAWYQGQASPYYGASHVAFRKRCRDFCEAVKPRAELSLERGEQYPRELHKEAYAAGLAGAIYPKECGGTPPADYDAFHELILWDEMTRIGVPGIFGALAINSMALPPVIKHGSHRMRREVVEPTVRGDKFCCLAIRCVFRVQGGGWKQGLVHSAAALLTGRLPI